MCRRVSIKWCGDPWIPGPGRDLQGLLWLPFPPTPFALQNPLQGAPTGVRTKSLQGRTSTPLEFLIAAGPIAGAAKYFFLR